jgi:hypothetical protein
VINPAAVSFRRADSHYSDPVAQFSRLIGRSRPVSDQSGRAAGGLRPAQKFQPLHIITQIHQSDLHCCPDLALGPHQDVALTGALVTEDLLDAGTDLRVPKKTGSLPFQVDLSTAPAGLPII